mmetsp:Transcript_125188/g.359538  ORF Transcript_125188/g.359538 Transcript_125188/m.359538 type:complete len:97 (-) Transcript_125188:252-542(-)
MPPAAGDMALRALTAEEVAKHSTEADCWIIVGDEVYDVTAFLQDHPGGKRPILQYAGKNATAEFDMLHDRAVIKKRGIEAGRVKAKGKLWVCCMGD